MLRDFGFHQVHPLKMAANFIFFYVIYMPKSYKTFDYIVYSLAVQVFAFSSSLVPFNFQTVGYVLALQDCGICPPLPFKVQKTEEYIQAIQTALLTYRL